MSLGIETRHLADVCLIELSGRASRNHETHGLEATLDRLLAENVRKFVLDLSGVNYMDSMGVGLLSFCADKVREAGGTLRVAGANGLVREVLSITRLDTVLDLFPSAEEACRAFTAGT